MVPKYDNLEMAVKEKEQPSILYLAIKRQIPTSPSPYAYPHLRARLLTLLKAFPAGKSYSVVASA